MKNEIQIKRRKRWFRSPEYRYTIIAAENGQKISGSLQWYSRRLDMENNVRRLYNSEIICQMDEQIARLNGD